MTFQLFKLFPETVAIYQLPYDKEEEVFLKKFKLREITESINKEKANHSYISENLNILNKNNCLKNKLLKCINNFANEQLGLNFKLKMTTSWLTKTLPNGFSQEHTHTLSLYSGVYYPFKSEKLYNIEFLKTENDFFQLSSYVNHFNHISNSSKFSVKSNTLIIFNSRVKHRVPKNETNEDRYSLAFNTMPVGILGDKNSDSQYEFKS